MAKKSKKQKLNVIEKAIAMGGALVVPTVEQSAEAVLVTLGKLNDEALEAQKRYLDLKERTKTAKETYDGLAEQVLTLLHQATHPSELPLFDREADQARMEAGPEAIQEATGDTESNDQAPSQEEMAQAEQVPF